MSKDEMRAVLVRLVDEFDGPKPMSERDVTSYTRHLQSLDAGVVNRALDGLARRGVWSRPQPGRILGAAGLDPVRVALLEERVEFQKWRDNYAEILARKPGESEEALRHAIKQADELLADVDRKLAA